MLGVFRLFTKTQRLILVLFVLFTNTPVLTGFSWDKSINMGRIKQAILVPEFDVIIKEIDSNLGETVLLPCTVRNLGDKVVSWIRKKDLSILTSGEFTFSTDNRFESVFSADQDFWGLRIRGVKITDTGQYECQVNTDPKMNLAVNLLVEERILPTGMSFKYKSIATIKSPKEVYVRAGSPVSLTCEISSASNDSWRDEEWKHEGRVRWLRGGREITSESDRGGVSLDTDYREEKITSRLMVSMVTLQDAGIYTCNQLHTRPDSIKIHVTQGEQPEAMQRDAAFSSGGKMSIRIFTILIYFVTHIT